MIDWIQSTAATAPPVVQVLVLLLAGAIPFIESYSGSALGVVAGVTPPLAIGAAIVGNMVSMAVLVLCADKVRSLFPRREKEPSKRERRFRSMFDKFGVPGVSLLGQTVLPSQITSMAMVAAGASRRAVIGWQLLSITLWGLGFGLLATAGLRAIGG